MCLCVSVCLKNGFVLVVLYFLSDLANLWSVESVGNSYCILDGYSGELIHASACVGFVQYLPCFAPVYCPSHGAHTHTHCTHTCAILIKLPFIFYALVIYLQGKAPLTVSSHTLDVYYELTCSELVINNYNVKKVSF